MFECLIVSNSSAMLSIDKASQDQGYKFALRFSHFAKKCECDATNSHSHRDFEKSPHSHRIRNVKISFAFSHFRIRKMRICAKFPLQLKSYSAKITALFWGQYYLPNLLPFFGAVFSAKITALFLGQYFLPKLLPFFGAVFSAKITALFWGSIFCQNYCPFLGGSIFCQNYCPFFGAVFSAKITALFWGSIFGCFL